MSNDRVHPFFHAALSAIAPKKAPTPRTDALQDAAVEEPSKEDPYEDPHRIRLHGDLRG
jgi:hypothetical protein